jgi:hypothetical protein
MGWIKTSSPAVAIVFICGVIVTVAHFFNIPALSFQVNLSRVGL